MKSVIDKAIRSWNAFFFKPQSASTLALFRIAFGLVVFLSTLGKIPVRELFYGKFGIVTERTMNAFFPVPGLHYFRWVPGEDPGLLLFFLVLLAASLTLTLGWFSRVSSVLVFLGSIALSNRNFFVENSGDDLLRINAFFLMFAPCGAAWSVDQWRSRAPAKLIAPWALRMIQLQLAYLYLNTAILKLPGFQWRDGTAIYYALQYIELRRFELKPLFYYLWQIQGMTYAVMVAEFAAGSLIWWRRARYPVLLAGMGLHFGINLTMQFPVFQYVMMASLLTFVYPEDLDRWMLQLQGRLKATKLGMRFQSRQA
jgi:hypothetical protein